MSDPQDPKSTPGQDVKKAFGLLYRAARTAVDQLPTKKFEEAVTMGAKEVGRAIENVANTIEKDIFKSGAKTEPPPPAPPSPPEAKAAEDEAHDPPETPPGTPPTGHA